MEKKRTSKPKYVNPLSQHNSYNIIYIHNVDIYNDPMVNMAAITHVKPKFS